MLAPSDVSRALSAPPLDPHTRTLLLALRQALLIALGALEDYLGLERSVTPKHKR